MPVKRSIQTRDLAGEFMSIDRAQRRSRDLKKIRAHSHIPEMRSTL